MAATKKIIAITGVPGSGKTSVAAELARMSGAKIISINDIVTTQGLYSSVDLSDGAKIAVLPKLQQALKKQISSEKRDVIIDGHLACELKFKATAVFVLRCHPDELKVRLSGRGYSQEKIKSNILSEMLDYCTLLCEKNFPKGSIFEIDTSAKDAGACAGEILTVMADKKSARKNQKKIDWSSLLFSQEIDFRNL